MDIEEVTGGLEGFLRGLESEHPETLGAVRRLELDIDEQGLARITTDAGAGWVRLG